MLLALSFVGAAFLSLSGPHCILCHSRASKLHFHPAAPPYITAPCMRPQSAPSAPSLICLLILGDTDGWPSVAPHQPPLGPHCWEGHVDDVEATLQPWGDDSPSTPRRAHGSHQKHILGDNDEKDWWAESLWEPGRGEQTEGQMGAE